MRYFAIASLKRGAIDPPEELPPWMEDSIWAAEWAAAQRRPEEWEPCIELTWMRQGLPMREEQRRKRRTA